MSERIKRIDTIELELSIEIIPGFLKKKEVMKMDENVNWRLILLVSQLLFFFFFSFHLD